MYTPIRKFTVHPNQEGTNCVVWRGSIITRRYNNITEASCRRLEELTYASNTETRAHIGQAWSLIFIYRKDWQDYV